MLNAMSMALFDPGKYVRDIPIDTERQPYTLENNIEGYSMDDMIRAHRSRCVWYNIICILCDFRMYTNSI